MNFDNGFDIQPTVIPFGFRYGKDVFGPNPEIRTLDAIRKNLMDPNCTGPAEVYSIAMDVGNIKDKPEMIKRNLLYGAVTYAAGTLGKEPVRSQGHIHAVSKSCGSSTPEVYEIWAGEAYIYMQETVKDNPGRCFAVHAKPGDVVIVPPYWGHATISANPQEALTFGAWCVRDFGFDYDDVRAHKGLAWFPIIEKDAIRWIPNGSYQTDTIAVKSPRIYTEFNIEENKSIYKQFQEDYDKFLFVAQPDTVQKRWEEFIP